MEHIEQATAAPGEVRFPQGKVTITRGPHRCAPPHRVDGLKPGDRATFVCDECGASADGHLFASGAIMWLDSYRPFVPFSQMALGWLKRARR